MNLKWVRSSYIQNMIQSSSLVWILLGEQGVHDVPEQVAPGVQPGQGALLPRRDHLSQCSYSGPWIDWDLRQKKARRIHPSKYSIFSAVCFTDIRYRIGTFSAARSPPWTLCQQCGGGGHEMFRFGSRSHFSIWFNFHHLGLNGKIWIIQFKARNPDPRKKVRFLFGSGSATLIFSGALVSLACCQR